MIPPGATYLGQRLAGREDGVAAAAAAAVVYTCRRREGARKEPGAPAAFSLTIHSKIFCEFLLPSVRADRSR